jgi:hypothetical protein
MVVVAIRLRIEATDLDAAAALGRNSEKFSHTRQFENSPAAVMENCLRRTSLRGNGRPRPVGMTRRERNDFAHRTS